MTTYDRLTCLDCGRFQGGEHPVYGPAPGWVQSGGFNGPMQVCPCCQGTGFHPITTLGIPACQDNKATMRRRTYLAAHDHEDPLPLDTRATIKAYEAALRVYAAETNPRTYAALVPLYGAARAADLMEEDPPL